MDALTYLFGLEQIGIKFGFENILAVLARLDHPERAFRTIHVAGTNGKGSVTAMIDSVLREAGHRSARYTSPHLVDLAERFVVGGQPVDAVPLCQAAGDVRDVIEALVASGQLQSRPTFFEATTALAFELFRRAGADVGVIEVGLGGRLDSTNVITPAVSVITSIDYDHQQYLGNTLGEIAAEKAGIVKAGVPVVVGEVGSEAFEAIARIARERGAELVRARDGVTVTHERSDVDASGGSRFELRTPSHDYGEIRLALNGAHQVANAVVAVRTLEVLDARGCAVPADAVVSGLAAVRWPGRLDRRLLPGGRELILDAAHNPSGAAALATYLRQLKGGKPTLVFAVMRDKDVRGMLEVLLPIFDRVIVTRASNQRSSDPEMLAREVRAVAPETAVEVARSSSEALAMAWRGSSRVVVAGSIFLLADVLGEMDA